MPGDDLLLSFSNKDSLLFPGNRITRLVPITVQKSMKLKNIEEKNFTLSHLNTSKQ